MCFSLRVLPYQDQQVRSTLINSFLTKLTYRKRQKGPSPKDYSTYERLKTQFDSLWICPLCLLQPGTKAPKCIYCETGPGVLVPCMIENRGDDRYDCRIKPFLTSAGKKKTPPSSGYICIVLNCLGSTHLKETATAIS